MKEEIEIRLKQREDQINEYANKIRELEGKVLKLEKEKDNAYMENAILKQQLVDVKQQLHMLEYYEKGWVKE